MHTALKRVLSDLNNKATTSSGRRALVSSERLLIDQLSIEVVGWASVRKLHGAM